MKGSLIQVAIVQAMDYGLEWFMGNPTLHALGYNAV